MSQRYIELGEHVCHPMNSMGGQTWHHGIYCGDCNIRGRQLKDVVIHYDGKDKGGKIRAIPLNKFFCNHDIYFKDYKSNVCFSPEKVVQNAISKLGEPDYGLFGNNCEHFAHWCKTGRKVSSQVNDFGKFAGQMISGWVLTGIGITLLPVEVPVITGCLLGGVLGGVIGTATGVGAEKAEELLGLKPRYKEG